MQTWYLGTHQPHWLRQAGVPLFISDPRLRDYKTLPVAAARWACDSGGFSELQRHGQWTVTPQEYVARLRRYRDEVGQMDWAAPQDWMCEDAIINGGVFNGQTFVGTHLSEAEHQRRTVLNYAILRDLAPDLNIIPVSQGSDADGHLRCVDLYWSLIGVDLTAMPLVGVGSVCRIQHTPAAGAILQALHRRGVTRLHGFGFKVQGLRQYGHLLTTADSQSWSFTARRLRRPALEQCVTAGRHKNCANCMPYALQWRTRVLADLARAAA